MLPDVHETLHVSFNEVFQIGQKRFSFGTNFVYFIRLPSYVKKFPSEPKKRRKIRSWFFVKRGEGETVDGTGAGVVVEATDTYTLL